MHAIGRDDGRSLLSIYIPTYNRVKKLKSTLEFFDKEFTGLENIEIIVSDNCSTDETRNVVNAMMRVSPLRIRYYCNNYNVGIVGNAYKASSYANGKFIWIVGDDDRLYEGIARKVYEILSEESELNSIFINYKILRGNDIVREKVYKGRTGKIENVKQIILNEFSIYGTMMMLTTSSIYRKEYLDIIVEEFPLSSIQSYAWSFMLGLYAVEKGNIYITDDVFLENQIGEISWSDVAYDSFRGMCYSLEHLTNIGYSEKKDRKNIIKGFFQYYKPIERIFYEMLSKKRIPQFFFNDLRYFFRICFLYTMKQIFLEPFVVIRSLAKNRKGI